MRDAATTASTAGATPTEPARPDTFYVSPTGSDDQTGSERRPWRTLQHAMARLGPGDTLMVGGGTYREDVRLTADILRPGRADAPVEVRARPGERVVVEGLLTLTGADHWTIRGINVTWSSRNSGDDHMVQFLGGTGWRFTEAEVWGARSFSAINVDEGARDFRLDHLYVHDTEPTNDRNQDHLIYVASGNEGGVIERNVLVGSPNGRGIKVGPGSASEAGSDGLVIRYNTLVDNAGPSSIRFSGDSSGNLVHHNVMVRPDEGEAAVTAFELEGTGNIVRNNVYWEAAAAVETVPGLQDGGGNLALDPMFANESAGDFSVTNPAATGYGASAPGG